MVMWDSKELFLHTVQWLHSVQLLIPKSYVLLGMRTLEPPEWTGNRQTSLLIPASRVLLSQCDLVPPWRGWFILSACCSFLFSPCTESQVLGRFTVLFNGHIYSTAVFTVLSVTSLQFVLKPYFASKASKSKQPENIKVTKISYNLLCLLSRENFSRKTFTQMD